MYVQMGATRNHRFRLYTANIVGTCLKIDYKKYTNSVLVVENIAIIDIFFKKLTFSPVYLPTNTRE